MMRAPERKRREVPMTVDGGVCARGAAMRVDQRQGKKR
jgi:hypothetical protein